MDLELEPAKSARIAGRTRELQHGLGAAASCAWSTGQFSGLANLGKALDVAI